MACELLVGPISDGTVVCLVGRGTMCESPGFREVAERLLEKGVLVFDASRCEYLDSTFLGCLIGLKKTCERSANCRFLIAASAATRIKLFCTSSLHRYFDFVDRSPELTGPWATIDVENPKRDELGQHIMCCHERLAELGGREAPAFRAIADRLAKELSGRVSVE
jgi:anti-anti-sigma regulatory factor